MGEHNMDKIKIVVVAGTIREGRKSFAAAQWVAALGRQIEGVEIIFVDPRDVHLPPEGGPKDGRDASYSDITAAADGFFIVTPEYNHGYPSSLKRLLDSEYDNYRHKPVVLAGASDGPWGGVRVCEALLAPLRSVGLLVGQRTVYFPFVQNVFDEQGQIDPANAEKYAKSIQGAYDELIQLARWLRLGRDGLAQ